MFIGTTHIHSFHSIIYSNQLPIHIIFIFFYSAFINKQSFHSHFFQIIFLFSFKFSMNKTNQKTNYNLNQQQNTLNQNHSMSMITNNYTLRNTLLLQTQNTPESTIFSLHSCFNNNAITSTKENIIPAVNSMFTWTLTHQPFTSVDMFHLDTPLVSFQGEICLSGRNIKILALCQDKAVVMSNLIGKFEKIF